ncbi:hypothetical protein GCK72_009800 [Caenorhabditis remanei]|uniref:Uncharacterized protein n=1 Tax=Caenorhabditis remanei TaxID=31234 RepID=A0A6A5H473_CAERE|nr:hypothetical protein GCK72_009800 [Caenorhabditis remanei]KAF1761544.1 hypothetical protein GCK72_009800 [Caenorhabditis remanei]
MASKTRRAAAMVKAEKMKKDEEKGKEEEVQDEDDDGPPPLEREASCGENDDTDGDAKEEDESEETSPNGIHDADDDIEILENKNEPKLTLNLLEALSTVFSADPETSPANKKRRISPTSENSVKTLPGSGMKMTPIPKSLLLRPSSMSSTLSTPSTRFTPLRQLPSVAGTSSAGPSGNRKYGLPPPIPQSLRNMANAVAPAVGVGSNTSLGPARLLENRKRTFDLAKRASALVAYNGGRAGEKFIKIAPSTGSSSSSGTSTSSSTAAIDLQSMLRDQSPVRMQVSVGGEYEQSNGDTLQEALEMSVIQKESIANVARSSTNHSLLLGSMVLNGLNTLQSRSSDEYNNFAGELFSLITKYNIN